MNIMFDQSFPVSKQDLPVSLKYENVIFVFEDVDAASKIVIARNNIRPSSASASSTAAAAPAVRARANKRKNEKRSKTATAAAKKNKKSKKKVSRCLVLS